MASTSWETSVVPVLSLTELLWLATCVVGSSLQGNAEAGDLLDQPEESVSS